MINPRNRFLININEEIVIPSSELSFSASRSSGPGGQHINKVSTKVTLLFDLAGSPSLTKKEKQKICKCLGKRINKKGILHISSQRYRSQSKNRHSVIALFTVLIQQAILQKKQRHKTKRPIRATEKRLALKKKQGQLKQIRKKFSLENFD